MGILLKNLMAFTDEITLTIRAGSGGNGTVRWLHTLDNEFAGPSGGDGGSGGNVYAEAVTNHPIIEYFRDPTLRPVNTAMVRQVLLIAQAEGITPMPFQNFDPDAYMRDDPVAINDSLERIIAGRAKSTKLYSGVWRDVVVRKRPTEVGEHLRPVIETGKRHGLPTALLEHLAATIKAVERGEHQISVGLVTGLLDKAARTEAERAKGGLPVIA